MKEQPSLTIEELFKKSWEAFQFNWKTFVGIPLLGWLASVLIASPFLPVFSKIRLSQSFLPYFLSQSFLFYFGLISLSLILLLIYLWTILSLVIAVRDWKEKIGIIESFKKSQDKIFDFFVVGILTSLVTLLGFLLLIIPGIVFWVYLSLVSFVLVCENAKGRAVLKRSWRLVKGHWWEIFAKLLVLMIAMFVVSWILSLGLSIISLIFAPLKWLLPALYEAVSEPAGLVLKSIPSLIVFPFSLIYTYLIYGDLKRIKEKSQNKLNSGNQKSALSETQY